MRLGFVDPGVEAIVIEGDDAPGLESTAEGPLKEVKFVVGEGLLDLLAVVLSIEMGLQGRVNGVDHRGLEPGKGTLVILKIFDHLPVEGPGGSDDVGAGLGDEITAEGQEGTLVEGIEMEKFLAVEESVVKIARGGDDPGEMKAVTDISEHFQDLMADPETGVALPGKGRTAGVKGEHRVLKHQPLNIEDRDAVEDDVAMDDEFHQGFGGDGIETPESEEVFFGIIGTGFQTEFTKAHPLQFTVEAVFL